MDNKINEQDAQSRTTKLMVNGYEQHHQYPSTREPPLVSSNAALHNMDDTDDIESIIRRAQQAQTNMPITQQELSQKDLDETPHVGNGLTPLQEKMERESAHAQHQYFSLANAGTNREVDDYSETSSPAIINTNKSRQIQTHVSSQVFQDMYVDTNRSPNMHGNNHHDMVQSPDLNEYHQEVNFRDYQPIDEKSSLNDYNKQLQVIKEMQDRLLATGHQQQSLESYQNVNSRDDMLNSLNNEYINSMADIAKFGKNQGKSAVELKTKSHLQSGQDTGHFNSQTQSIPDAQNGVTSTSQTIQNLKPIEELDSQAEAILVPLDSSHPSQVDLKLNILKTTTRSTNRNHSKVAQSQNFEKQKSVHSNYGRSDNSRGKSHDSYAQHSPLRLDQQNQDSMRKSVASRNIGMRTQSVGSANGQSVRITNQNGNTIPSSIHSESGLRFNITTFAQRFNKLYSNIKQIFPNFSDEIGPINHLDSVTEEDLPFNAGQVFQQMSFMYQTAKALKLKEVNRSRSQSKQGIEQFSKQKGRKDSDLDGLMNDQAQVANNMLKYQLENTQREAEYYKKQMDVFKEQLQISALRERDSETQFQQRIQDLDTENSNYQRRINELDNMVNQLQSRTSQLSGNISFRAKTKDSSVEADLPNFRQREVEKSPQIEDSRLINSLQNEAKELRIKVKMEKEACDFEKQRSRDFQQKLNNVTEAFQLEIGQIRRENELLRDEKNQKGKTIDQLNEQIQDFARNVSIEFPLVIKKEALNSGVSAQSPGLQLNGALQTSSVNLSNQKPRYVQMNSQKSQKKADAQLDLDMDQILNDMPFMNATENGEQELDQNSFKMLKNSQMPLRGKSGSGLRKKGREAANKQNQAAITHTNQMASFFQVQQMAKSQIASVLIADQIIKEQETLKKDKNTRLDKQLEIYNDIEKRIELIQNEKKEFNDKQIALTKENEDLKVKFSQLLDQFQEYVNESEKKIEEDQVMQKDEQERILGDLNGTIKELEDMSKNLQRECQNKDTQIESMQDEINKLEKDCKDLREQKEQTEKHVDGIQVVKMQSLNDEITYLKKHYMVEMDILRNENKLLRQKGRSNNCNTPVQERTYDNREIQISPYPQNTRHDQDFHRDDNDLRLSRQKSQMMNRQNNHDGNSQYAVPYGENLSAIDRRDGFSDRENSLFVSGPQREAQQDYAMMPNYNQNHQNRSKSHDRVMGHQRPSYHREPHNDHHDDRRSFSRERDNRHDYTNYHSRDHSAENQPAKAKTILSGVQGTIDQMKRDLKDKDRLIEQKNREIVKLRMENDEYKSNFENVDSLVVSQHQRNKIVNEMESVVDTLKLELERTKRSLFKEESHQSLNSPVMHNNERIQSQHVITCEDKLIQMVMEKIKTMRGLISLASEIFLLSNKQKYGPDQNLNIQSTSENEHLIQENKSLHRKIYKYETTMQQMDDIFRREDQKDDIIFELKKLTQNQLQEILKLQNQQQLHQQMGEIKPSQQHQDLFQENRVLKQEISLMREQAARSQQLQDGNNDLMNERRTLLLKVEQLDADYKDAQNQMNELNAHKRESDKQFEELRNRITVVAELFEKKPIKQKYSFEVLCDFIHDKAKRLFTKYENAIKDKKAMQEEKSFYFQRKIQELQKEKEQNKESMQQIKNNLIPKISNLLNKQFNSKDIERLSPSFLREIADDLEYQFGKYKQDFFKNQQNQERIKELQMMVDRLSNLNGYQNSQSNYTNVVDQKTVNSYGHTVESQNFNNGNVTQQEFEQMRQEKIQLNKKLEEFSHILQDFKSNQRTQTDENNQLKQKISLLEQQKQSYKMSEAGFDGSSNSHIILDQAALLGNKPIQVSDHMTLMSQDRTIDPTAGPLSNGNYMNHSQFGQPFSSTSTQNLAMNPNIIHSNKNTSKNVQGVINSEWGDNETEVNQRQTTEFQKQ